MSLGQLTSDVFLSCKPTAAAQAMSQRPAPTVFTTEYCFTAPAACLTAEWTATYTIREVCTGDPARWAQPSVPPNFIKTIVTCDVCEHKTQTITCPVEQAIQTGSVNIHGNGVTATPALAPAMATVGVMGGGGATTAGPGSTSGSDISGFRPGGGAAVATHMGGSNPGSGSESPASNLGSPAAAAAAIVGPGSFPGTGTSGTDSSGDAAAAIPSPSLMSKGSFSGANSGSAAAATAAIVGSKSSSSHSGASASDLGVSPDGSLPTVYMPESTTETDAASSTYDTADASGLKNSLVLVSTAIVLALVASHLLL